MKKFRIVSITTLFAFALCWSCTFHNVEDDLSPDCAVLPVTFSDTIFPIFMKYCSNSANGDCHYSGAVTGKPDYTAYAGIKQKVTEGRIQARLFDHNPSPMPPSYSNGPKEMSDCEKTLIQRWIDDGAPNN